MTSKPFTHWECPECGYLIDDIKYQSFRYDYACSRCGKTNLSDYIGKDDKPEETCPRKSG